MVLLTSDAQKAFDLVNWPFMFETLDSFEVDNKFETIVTQPQELKLITPRQ